MGYLGGQEEVIQVPTHALGTRVPPAASLATFLFVELSSRPVLDTTAVPNGLLQMI